MSEETTPVVLVTEDRVADLETQVAELQAEHNDRLADLETQAAEVETLLQDHHETVAAAIRGFVAHQAVEAVKVLRPEPGDIISVKLGISHMGDGLPPWLPGPEELEHVYKDVSYIAPEGVKVIVSHLGVNYEIVRDADVADVIRVESIPVSSTES